MLIAKRKVKAVACLSWIFLGLAPVSFAAAGLPRPMDAAGRPSLRGSAGGKAQGYLGIEFHDVPEEQLKNLRPNSAHGVEVVMVDHDGPAGKAGLRAHDIIVSLNGQAVPGEEAFRKMLHGAGAGVQVALTIFRSGQSLNLTARLANRADVTRAAMAHLNSSEAPVPTSAETAQPGLSPADSVVTPPPPPTAPATPAPGSGFIGHIVHGSIYTGAVLDTMEPQLAGFFGAAQGVGLLVHSVEPNSPASLAGLRAGDVLIRADLYTLHTSADWTKRLHAAKGHPITLSVLRDRREMTLTLQQDLKHRSMLDWPSVGLSGS